MTVRIIQHLPHEHAGVLGEVLAVAGIPTTTIRAWTGEAIPIEPDDIAARVVLGGDMNTDEEERWPHLTVARQALARAVEVEVPTLGLCLGAQLLAEATGGSVAHGTPEIGYPPVFLTPSGRSHPTLAAGGDGTPFFNAHADQITPPADASLLAFSDATPVHAFSIGSGLGLQFHPEIDASFVASYIEAEGVESYLAANEWTGPQLVAEARRRNVAHRAAGAAVFTAWMHQFGIQ